MDVLILCRITLHFHQNIRIPAGLWSDFPSCQQQWDPEPAEHVSAPSPSILRVSRATDLPEKGQLVLPARTSCRTHSHTSDLLFTPVDQLPAGYCQIC